MFIDILCNIFDTFFINLSIIFVKIDKSSQTILTLQNTNLLMNNFNLFSYKLTDTGSLPSIINLHFFIMSNCLLKQLFLIILEKRINIFINILFVLNKLIMDTFPQPKNVVIYFIIRFTQLLKNNYILITFLLCLTDCLQNIDICWLGALDKMLLGMLNNAIGTQRHQTVYLTTEICQVLVRMICTVNLFHLFVVIQRAVDVICS